MRKISIVLIVALLMVTVNGSASAQSNYRVLRGDNLYNIGQKVGIRHELIMAANDLESSLIYPGQVLNIPNNHQSYYTVQAGDNLFRIAKKYGTSLNILCKANDLEENLIFVGQKLVIPIGQKRGAEPVLSGKVRTFIEHQEIELLAKLIHAEARGEDYLGQLAVGAVILNRLASEKFPDSIREIIFQRTKGGYQFTPVGNGSIEMTPSPSALKAAKEAIAGKDPTGGALFFYNPETSTDRWIKTLPVTKVIGNHVFAR